MTYIVFGGTLNLAGSFEHWEVSLCNNWMSVVKNKCLSMWLNVDKIFFLIAPTKFGVRTDPGEV